MGIHGYIRICMGMYGYAKVDKWNVKVKNWKSGNLEKWKTGKL